MTPIVPVEADVLGVFAAGQPTTRPWSIGDIAARIAEAHGVKWDAYGKPVVNMHALQIVLDALTGDHTAKLWVMRGHHWRGQGIVFHDLRGNVRYYALPDDVARWRQNVRDYEEALLLERAQRGAAEALQNRHAKEYQQLVDRFVEELRNT